MLEIELNKYLTLLMPTTTTECDPHVALAYSSKLVSFL